VLKNYLHGKTFYIEILFILKILPTLNYWYLKLLALKNFLDSKIGCMEKLLILKNHFKHPKRENHKKMV